MKSVWNRLSTGGRVVFLFSIVAAGAAVVLTARRDLASREASAIRGDPEIWRRVTLFPGGATAYLVAGRRQGSSDTPARDTA